MVVVVDKPIHNHNAAMLVEDVPRDDVFSILHVFLLLSLLTWPYEDVVIISISSLSLSVSFHRLKGDLDESAVIILLPYRKTGQVSNIFVREEFHRFSSHLT